MDGVLDFFGSEAGQRRRAALDNLSRNIGYYIPPELRGLLGVAAQMTPTSTLERAAQASERMFGPDRTASQRVGDLGAMLSETAGIAAPVLVAGRAAIPAAQAVQEGLLGFSMGAQDVGRAVADRLNQPGQMPTLYSNPLLGPIGAGSGGIRAYQGSPHDFAAERLVRYPDGRTEYIVGRPDVLPDVPAGAEVLRDFPMGRMRMDKIGTGEGAQAYGYGLYTAEAEGVARGYRDALSDPNATLGVFKRSNGEELSVLDAPDGFYSLLGEYPDNASYQQLLDAAQAKLQWAQTRKGPLRDELTRKAQAVVDFVERNEGIKFERNPARGRMYEVSIRANPEDFLDWDKPLSEQPQAVLDALNPMIQSRLDALEAAGQRGRLMASERGLPDFTPKSREQLYQEMRGGDIIGASRLGQFDQMAEQVLSEAGVPGIRYLDAGSRGAGDGSRNYVVFNENLIDIVRKYGIAGAAALLGLSVADIEAAMAAPAPDGLLAQEPRQ